MPDDLARSVQQAADAVRSARRISVISGAGLSTDSGIPDFRGPNGVWTKNPEAEKLATLDHYMADPEVRRRAWKARRASPAFRAEPNAGHFAIYSLAERGKLDKVITQNIDGLHQKAGHPADQVIEIHGTVHDFECMGCGDRGPIGVYLSRVEAGEDDPPCRACGGIVKTATISFGQNLRMRDLERAEEAARSCDLMLAVGTTLSVYPAAAVVPLAKQAGAAVVIVNGSATDMDALADVVVQGSLSEALPVIVGD